MRHRAVPAYAAGLLALVVTACGDDGSAEHPHIDASRAYEEYTAGTDTAAADLQSLIDLAQRAAD